jgi:hypothetical protein
MKVEKDAVLTCTVCGVEGPHRLIYLSNHLYGSECETCGAARVYSSSGHLYAAYTVDLAQRSARLPLGLARRAFERPTGILKWPIKGIQKPFGILNEVTQVVAFEYRLRRRQST